MRGDNHFVNAKVHFLIVEDTPDTLELMRDYLQVEYPGAEIHTADTVDGAFEVIDGLNRLGVKLKVAVLDFKLPKGKGDQPEIETRLSERLRETASRDAVVFHITGAAPTDARIQRFIAEEQLRAPRLSRPLISKLKPDWTDLLYKAIAQVIHGDRIADQLNRLFGAAAAPGQFAARGRMGPYASGDPTHDLAALMRDIRAHWGDLDDQLKQSIREVFHVQEGKEKPTVSLF